MTENHHAEWITLGTAGGPEVHPEQSQIADALVVDGAVYLFDLGNGVLRQLARAGESSRRLRAVFLTHHHRDHNSDLGPVILTHWQFTDGSRLPIHGPRGTRHLALGLCAANAPTTAPEKLAVGRGRKPALEDSITAEDLPVSPNAPISVYDDELISVSAIGVDHFHAPPTAEIDDMPQAVAYRIEAGGRTFVYSGDTGPSSRLTSLARGADVLITEVVDLEAIKDSLRTRNPDADEAAMAGHMRTMTLAHLTGDEIGRIADRAGVGAVVLTHYVPSFADQSDTAGYGRGIAESYSGPVAYSRDLDRF